MSLGQECLGAGTWLSTVWRMTAAFSAGTGGVIAIPELKRELREQASRS
jgi:hypothetical protein